MKIQFRIDPCGCWLWLGQLNRNGYGRVYVAGRRLMAHRVIYEAFTGRKIPEGIQLDHKKEVCSHRHCVNPAHMEEVTGTVNTRRHSGTKLTEEDARMIRESLLADSDLARILSVSRQTISDVRKGLTWTKELSDASIC